MRREPQQQRLGMRRNYEIYTGLDLSGLNLVAEMNRMEMRLVLEVLRFH